MKIKKIKSEGQYIYPATIASAVKDTNFLKEDNSPMTQGEINIYLNSLLSSDKVSKKELPTDIPCIWFDGALPTAKDQGEYKGACHIHSKQFNIDCYSTIKVQGNSSTAYNKKNFTIKFYSDAECTIKKKIDFGWGPQSKYVMKANWIDITHSRNIVSARLWSDVVKSRPDYDSLPELLKTSPNNGAIDGFPIKFYGNNVYWGRYSMNIPKDAWMTNMDKTNPNQLILCGENYNEALFRALARWDETDWTDELHSEVPAELLARFNQFVSFVMESTNQEFREHLSEYVNIQSVLDYYIFGLLICNLDGFGKNHIWLSYDGNKFIASAYDMDSTFGLYWNGSQLLPASYDRNSFEDMTNGRLGNLLYIRLVNNFYNELLETFNRLINGPMSFANVLNRFEEFISITPNSLVAEDYASTTGNNKCTGIPSKTTNNIQYIRQWYSARLKFIGLTLNVTDIILPEPFMMLENKMFDGDGTNKAPINTGCPLFSNDPEWQVWTLQLHTKANSGTSNQRAVIHCMDESLDRVWPGFAIQSPSGSPNNIKAEFRIKNTNSETIKIIQFNISAEQYIALQRNGDTIKYCIDGMNWITVPGRIYEHNYPLILGGYCDSNGQVLEGASGREINGVITARLWKDNIDAVMKFFVEEFPKNIHDFNHNINMMSYDQLEGMLVGQSVEVVMVNPHANNGYILGYNNEVVGTTGTSTLENTRILIDDNADDTHKMIISKVAETRTEQQEITRDVVRTFNVINSDDTLEQQISSISGYNLWKQTCTKNQSGTTTITFDGTELPRTVYVKAYNSNDGAMSISLSEGTVIPSTDNIVESLSNFTAVEMTSSTLTITQTVEDIDGTYYLYVLVPNDITESVTSIENVEIPTENTYYTIKSKVGNYGPTGTNNAATWSTDLMQYQIENAIDISAPYNVTANINTNNNPCMIRFINPTGNYLNAGGAATSLKYNDDTDAQSIWILWLLDNTQPTQN